MTKEEKPQGPVRWRKFLVKGTFWLSTELMLGVIGMDTLADYSEFLTHSRVVDHIGTAMTTITTLM
jgi:hypothetical protein